MKTKMQKVITALFMLCVMTLSVVLPSFVDAKREELETRDINVEALSMLTYEDKAEEILSNFDEYEITNDENVVSLDAMVDLSESTIVNNEALSENAITTIKKYSVDLDIENEKFYIVVQYYQDEELVSEEKVETIPHYDEYTDDYLVEMPDGTTISMYETLMQSNLDECSVLVIAGVTLTAYEAALLLAAVAIVAYPVIEQVVTVVVETIVTWVRSFWRWFKSLWTAKTTTKTTTVVSQAISYTVSISNVQVKVKQYDKSRNFEDGKYYVAIADTADGLLYVSDYNLSDVEALAILTSSTYVTGATKGKNGQYPQLVLSIYTKNNNDAYSIAVQAGTILGDPGAMHHNAHRTGYFNHYHPGSQYTALSHPHVFYGQPL